MKLTDDQIWDIWNSQGSDEMNCQEASEFARAIEAEVLRLNGGGGEAVKRGFVSVPLKMTREMQDYLSEEDWDWPELLAIAGAVAEEEYDRAVELAAPQPQQAAPETIVFNNPSYEPWLREQAAHMQVTGPLHVVCRCDSCKASQQAAPGAVLEGWRSVADDVSSRVIDVLSEMAIAPILSKAVAESNRSFEYIDRDLVVKSITKIRRAVSELAEYSRLSAAPKPQGE